MNKRCPTVCERDALLSEMNEKRVALGLAQISEHNFIKYIIRYQCWHLFIYLFCSFLHLIIAHINTCYDFFYCRNLKASSDIEILSMDDSIDLFALSTERLPTQSEMESLLQELNETLMCLGKSTVGLYQFQHRFHRYT